VYRSLNDPSKEDLPNLFAIQQKALQSKKYRAAITRERNRMTHHEVHRAHRVGWLRASVLGANDGIVSTASLIIGFAAASTTREAILLAGVAGLVAGAMSMAAGEYVSVSSQADTEAADLALEKKSLEENYEFEQDELAKIYEARGLSPDLASQVATELMAHDALAAHARDEIGITEGLQARPVQAALSSAATFTLGAALPLLTAWLVPLSRTISIVALFSLVFLAVLGAIAARTGGASMVKGAARVTFWGALAMGLTAGVGKIFGVAG
jgi:VIT1/CCC1 family predicted Fe2+/Mn2+ transporter